MNSRNYFTWYIVTWNLDGDVVHSPTTNIRNANGDVDGAHGAAT